MTLLGVLSFTEQGMLNVVMTSVTTFIILGVYDIVNNLGSLVARFVFLPIEESFYIFFSSTLLRGEYCSKQSQVSCITVHAIIDLLCDRRLSRHLQIYSLFCSKWCLFLLLLF